MQPTIKELHDNDRFTMVRKLNHSELVEFVLENIKPIYWPIAFFYLFNLFILLYTLIFGISAIYSGIFGWRALAGQFFFGLFAGMIVVIPFHELLHGLAYKLTGAPRVKFGARLKQMLFYAEAPGFVAGRRQFYLVALLPFIIINLFFISCFLFSSPANQWASLIALLSHSSLCIGDFAMMNFFASRKNSQLFTYDDPEEKVAYFYEKKPVHFI